MPNTAPDGLDKPSYERCPHCRIRFGYHEVGCPELVEEIVENVTTAFRNDVARIMADHPEPSTPPDGLDDTMLAPCPFCGGAVQFRKALWPSDGCMDAVIHTEPTTCGMAVFANETIDESLIAAWNTRTAARLRDDGGILLAISEMMRKHVTNWPEPKKLSTAIKLIDKTLAASLSALPEAQGGVLTYTNMGSGGRCSFQQLREAVAEATCGYRSQADPAPENIYPGHVMVGGINYNSLDRIVTAFVDAALRSSDVAARGKGEG